MKKYKIKDTEIDKFLENLDTDFKKIEKEVKKELNEGLLYILDCWALNYGQKQVIIKKVKQFSKINNEIDREV